MLGKNNHYLRRLREGEKITHYTIKKLSVGVASVAVGSFIMLNSGQAYAAEPASVQPATAHTQAESSDGTGASQESSVSEQAAVLSASSEEASLVSAESSQSSETSASSESANSNEANSSESSQSSADESKPEQKEDSKLEPSRQNDTRKTPGYAVKPVEKPASAAMPRPEEQGKPMTPGTGLRGKGTGDLARLLEPKGPNLIEVVNPQSLTEEEKRQLRATYIRLNPKLKLTDENIEITSDGRVIVDGGKKGQYVSYLDEVVKARKVPAATVPLTVNDTFLHGVASIRNGLLSTDDRITGNATPNATIRVIHQDNSIQEVQVNSDGTWEVQLNKVMLITQGRKNPARKMRIAQIIGGQTVNTVEKDVELGGFKFVQNPLSTSTNPNYAHLVAGQRVFEILAPLEAKVLSLETNLTNTSNNDTRSQLSIKWSDAEGKFVVHGGGTYTIGYDAMPYLIEDISVLPSNQFGYQIIRITVSNSGSDDNKFRIKATGELIKELRREPPKQPGGKPVFKETGNIVPVVYSMKILPKYDDSSGVISYYNDINKAPQHSYADATNVAPSIEVAPGKATKEVSVGQSVSDADILSMVNVTDPEDDARQTVGTPVAAEIVSRTKDGQTFDSIDTSSEGEYTVTLRAKDSQGKLSDSTVQVQVLVGLKREAAKQAVADAAQRKNTEIDNNVDLTTEERAVERQKVTDAQNSANAAIDQAKTSQALATAQNNGTSTINALTQTPVAKPAARAAIETAANNKVQQINKSQSLTNEERTEQIAAIRQKEAAAKQAVAAQTSTQDVTSTQNAQVQAINDTLVLAFKKPAALAAIEAAEAAKRQQIQDSQMLAEEKTAALRDLDSKVQAAKQSVRTAQSNQDVENIKNNQLSQIQAVPTQSPARQAATNEIMDAYNARKQLISNESWLTTDEKNEKLRELETAKDEALERVNQANGEYELNSAKTDGISTVNSVSVQGTKKPDAKDRVDAVREAMFNLLNAASSDWTAQEKTGAADKLLRIAEETEARITAATSNDNLQQVVNELLAEIEAVRPPAIVKPAARKAIEEALAERIKQIQAQGDLTVEEREQYLEQVKQAAQDAHRDILASYGEVEVEHAKDTALAKINAPAVPVKRNTALAAVRQEAETKRQEIENNLDLTANERDVLLGQVDQVLAAAEQAINQGARNADVEDKQTEGTNNIRAIQVQASVRPQAIQAVTEQANTQRQAINQAQGLTENERQAALNQLDQTLAKAIEDIKAADDNEEVGNAKTKGIQAIQAVTAVAKIKNEAIQSVRQVADAKKDNIQQNTDLTSEERKTLTDAIEAEVQKAVGLINQANSNETVTAEKNLAEETIANLLVTPEVKPNAIKELQDQAAIKTREIQENKSLTDEERQKFTQDLQQALDNAKKQIQDAENNQAVSDAKTQGLGNIVAISPYGQVKADALAEIEAAREAKSREIQSKEGLTAEERQAAETRLATEVQTAKDSIGQAADNAGVGNAKSYGLTAIQAIKPEPLTKQAANEALENAAQTKRQQITDNKNLTTQEKQKAIEEVNQALATAKGKVEQASGRDDVAQAQAQGLTNIGDVTGQAVKKPQANADIEAAVAAKRQEIEGNKTLTNEERLTAYTQLEAKHQDALQAIADAASNEDVEQALNTHKSGIESFTPTASVRQAALDAFDREAAVRANTINNYSDFTDEEREDHKQRFEALRDQLRQMIQDAGTDREVEDARDNGISGIHGFSIVATKKSDAVKSLNEEAQTKRQQIQTAPNLTDEERVELNKKVDQVLADVVLNVHRQKTNDKVQEANETGVEKIRAIGTESKIKAAANQALGTAAENKRNEIRQNNLLTKEEKDKAIESVDQALTDALQAIQQATTNQQVGDQESQGLQAIQNVPQTPVSKPAALAEVRQAAANKTSTIQSNDNLTSDEKAEAIQKVNTELAKAEKDINEAADDLTVGVVKQGGITNIGNVQAIPSVKPAAIYELEEAASNRRREIQQTEGLTKEEREQALAQVENALQTARQAITQADSNAAVATQKTQGIQNIQAVTATPNAKPTAINEIEAAAETRRKEIQELPGLTQDEINAAKERVNQAATLAKREVEAAADQNAVDQAKTNGLVAINAVTQEAKARPDAIKEVVAAADRKKAELRDNQDLTIEERAQLIQDVDTAVDRAKDAINAAETNDKVAQEQTNGTQAIAAITANPVAKPAAKKAIEEAAQVRREAIDRLEGLTTEEKTLAKLAVTQAEMEALESLKQAQQKTDVDQVQSNGIATILAVLAQAHDKPDALQEIQAAADAKKRQIEESKAFTQEEKNEAIQKITQAVQDAQAKINQAEDRTGVSNAKGDGLAAIEAIQAVAQTKPTSLAAIAISEQAKKNEIENNNQLTREEKNDAISAVEAKARDARTAIENANTLQEVEEQERQGKFAINSVPQVPTTKATAINEIEAAAATKRQEIRDKEGLTEEERNQALAKVDSAVQNARNAINTADTNALVGTAKDNGLGAIRAIEAEANAKPAAIAAVEQAANVKKAAIQANDALTSDEKAEAERKVNEELSKAQAAIRAAASDEDVTREQGNGTTAISGVAETPVARPTANQVVEAAAAAKRQEIKSNDKLTEEEQQAALAKVDEAERQAKEAIKQATSTSDVEAQGAAGKAAIEAIKAIEDQAQSTKDLAKAAITQAEQDKKRQIENNTQLTREEKNDAISAVEAKAEAARNAIDAAKKLADVQAQEAQGKADIAGVPETPAAKNAAKAAIQAAADLKKDEIRNNGNLTDEEKAEAIGKVDEAVTKANQAIDEATTNQAVTDKQTEGTQAIQAVPVTAVAKPAAIAAVQAAADAKKQHIQANGGLTEEERKTAIAEVESELAKAKQAIQDAAKQADVTGEQTKGIAAINNVAETPSTKTEAKEAIERAAEAQRQAIQNRQDLTQDEKDAAKAQVTQAAASATKEVEDAADQNAVTQAKTNGTNTIAGISPAAKVRPDAIKAVEAAAEAKKREITDNQQLTSEEKAKAIQAVNDAVQNATAAINAAGTNAKVAEEQGNGTTAIAGINPSPVAKPAAIAAVEQAANVKKAAIQANDALTSDEKAEAERKVNEELSKAQAAIRAAASDEDVTREQGNGTTAISGVAETPVARPTANQVVEAAAAAKRQEIKSNDKLTEEEQQAALAKVDEAERQAKEAIKQATSTSDVEAQGAAGKAAIEAIKAIEDQAQSTKDLAKAAITQAEQDKKRQIENNTQLTREEKNDAISAVEAKAEAARNAIDAAKKLADVQAQEAQGKADIAGVPETPAAKNAAKAAIQAAADLKKDEIRNNGNLTDEEKAEAIGKVDEAVTKANQAIDEATTNQAVTDKQTEGTQAIQAVPVTAVAKPAAIAAVQAAADAKKQHIQANGGLTEEERKTAIAEVESELAKAKQAIQDAAKQADVTGEQTKGIAAINNVAETPSTKTEAKEAIERAAEAQRQAIQNRQDLTQDEKDAAKAKVTQAAATATKAVEDAADQNAVTQAKTNGTTAIAGITPEAKVRPDAIKEVEAAAEAKKREITDNKELTAEEQAKAIQAVTEAVQNARNAINGSDTNALVGTAKEAGLAAIGAIQGEAKSKPAALAAVAQAAETKKQGIERNAALTSDEKAEAVRKVNEELAKAQQAIKDAADDATVTAEKDKGVKAISDLTPTPVAKPTAQEAIQALADSKKGAIQADNRLTQEEKNTAINQIQAAADAAKQAIASANSDSDVANEKTAGEAAINAVAPTPTVKPTAKDQVQAAADAKKQLIQDRGDLTKEEKKAAKAAIDKAAQDAQAAIDAATTDGAVANEKANGLAAIEAVTPGSVAKTDAKQAINAAANLKKDAIQERTDLTQEEKEEAIKQVEEAAKEARNKVDTAATDAQVVSEKDAGLKAITDVTPNPIAKPTAKQAVQDLADLKKSTIEADKSLTREEKDAAIKQVEDAAKKAKEAIDAAPTNSQVATDRDQGKQAIADVTPVADAKPKAKEAVEQAANAKKAAIEADKNLTREEKDAAISAVDQAAQAAKTAIAEASDNSTVANEQGKGTSAIAGLTPVAETKPKAKEALEQAANAKKAAIEANNNLTREEKEAAKAKVDAAVAETKDAIDAATTNAEVAEASKAGADLIDALKPSADKKTAAKAAIDAAVKTKTDAIDARTDLTQEEKDAAKAKLAQEADKAKAAIDAASTNSDVDAASQAASSAINGFNPTADAKTAAKAAIDQAVADKAKEIDARTDLTQEEKEAAKAKLADTAKQAKAAIDAATTNAEVDAAVAAGTKSIKDQSPSADAKNAAKAAIDQAVADKAKEIDVRTDLTKEEKDAAKAKLADAANKAKAAIDAATTNAEVDAAVAAGTKSIKDQSPTADAKNAAKAAIDQAVADKAKEIDARTDLTKEEKDAAKAKLADAAKQAKAAIDAATTNAEVDAAVAAGTKSIADQSPSADAKTAAKAAIDQAVADKAKEIDARTDLTQEEKDAAKAKLADAANKAKAAIDAATTNAEVDAALAAGTKSIKDQTPTADAKTAAKAAIDQAVADKAKEIDARTDLTQEEKDAAKAKLADAAKQAKAAIDAATTNAEVDAAVAAGTKSIANQSPTADAKNAAKAAIDQAVADKAKEIDARTDLTQEEKDAAKAKLADAAKQAKAAIDAATTNAEVDAAVAAGTKSIADQSPTADAKNAAKAAIDQAVADKAKEIDARTDLTQEEKDAAKAKLADTANKAKAAIDAATTNADVAAVVKQAQASLKDFSPSSDSKSDSKLAIDQASQAKIDALKARKDLNDADKAKAIAQVQDLAQKAKDAIDQASSQDQVKAILDQALADLAALNPAPSQVPCPDCQTQAPCPDCDAKKQGLLPATGETSNQTFFSAAALAVLAGLGLVATGKRKDEEEQVS